MATRVFKGGDKLRAAIEALAAKAARGGELRVGFLEGATYPDEDHTPVATVAAYNEFGTDRIPPRPFMRNTIAKNEAQWGKLLAACLKITGGDAEAALSMAGEKIAAQMQAEIRAMSQPVNAPSTVARKGFDKPLIDTGHMLNSVSHEVKGD